MGTGTCKLFFSFVVFCFCISIACLVLNKMAEPILPETHPPEVLYPFLSAKFEEEWMNTLAHGKINHVEIWNPYGLSKKFKVIFEDGKVSSGKLMRPFSFWPNAFHELTFKEYVI